MKKLLVFALFSCINFHADAMRVVDFKELYFFIYARLKNMAILYQDSSKPQNELIDNDADISSNEDVKKVVKKKKKIFKKKNIKKYLENSFKENCDEVTSTSNFRMRYPRKNRSRKKSDLTENYKIFESDSDQKLNN